MLYSKNVENFSLHMLAIENTGARHNFLSAVISVPSLTILLHKPFIVPTAILPVQIPAVAT